MDDGELIERVSQFRFLYDKKDTNFKNKIKKENAWQTISAIMGFTPLECDQRWTVLRNKYTTLKRSAKNRPSGSEAYTISWPYYSLMKFLDPFIQQRRTTTNFSASRSNPQYSGVTNIINNIVDSESEEEVSQVIEIPETHYNSEEEDENSDDTQELYETFLKKRKKNTETPPAKRIASKQESQNLSESPIVSNKKNLAEIKRLNDLRKTKPDNKSDKENVVNKLGGCLQTFEKFIESKQTSQVEEDFVRSLARDLSVFTPTERISLKHQFYECMDKKVRERKT